MNFIHENKVLLGFERMGQVCVTGATLPVVAFLLLGIYGKVIWLMISVIILGIGHIGIHLEHLKEIEQTR